MSGIRIDIMTLFPDSTDRVLSESIIGRAAAKGLVEVNCVQIRDYTKNKQRQVDDYPYGGGWGCVMMAQPLKSCLDSIMSTAGEYRSRVIYMSPQGKTFTQAGARRLRDEYDHLVLVCGHYEGIDERFIEECVDEEISIGDFVLTGGEIAAMAVTDAVCRLVPGVLSDEECFTGESHWDGLLEYPQYTRPEVWEGRAVPQVLLSGNHANIDRWRRSQSILRTMDKRPDMFERLELSDEGDRRLLGELLRERSGESADPVFKCRRGTAEDIPAIMEIISDARRYLALCGVDQWQEEYPSAEDFEADIWRGECWVTICGERIDGVMTVSMSRDEDYDGITEGNWLTDSDNYGVIHRSAVRTEMRGTPLAAEMFDFAEALCLGTGKQSIRIDTHEDNKSMQGLLKKLGYTFCGKIARSIPECRDPNRIALEKTLQG